MKELTIEQKAKAYDKVVNKLKGFMIQGVDPLITRADVRDFFPELKESEESEDDRIRKGLISMCQTLGKEEWVAWLEKQGEQWSEEDEARFESCIKLLQTSDGYDTINTKWFKSLKDRVQPQPKQEWNEEDINMIDWLIRCCEKEHEELCNDKYGHQDIVSDLKRDCRKKWDWLESLKNRVAPQKQWKPSEEMLEALYRAIPENVMEISEDEMLLDKLYQGLKYGRVLSNK